MTWWEFAILLVVLSGVLVFWLLWTTPVSRVEHEPRPWRADTDEEDELYTVTLQRIDSNGNVLSKWTPTPDLTKREAEERARRLIRDNQWGSAGFSVGWPNVVIERQS